MGLKSPPREKVQIKKRKQPLTSRNLRRLAKKAETKTYKTGGNNAIK
jgi:hypothetical protein